MAATLAEKILARVAGRDVAPGEVFYPLPDLVTVHDWYVVNFDRALRELGVERLFDPAKVIISTDHEPVAVSADAVARQRRVREIVAHYGISEFFDAGRAGHGHLFPIERGMVRPGMFVMGYDVHVTNFGAVGCLAIPMGTEISEVLACGSAWVRVPETVRVELRGRVRDGISIRDVAQHLLTALPSALVDYAVVEYGGPGLAALSIDQRITLCNTPIETGAKSVIAEVDVAAAAWIADRAGIPVAPLAADPDAHYRARIEVDLALADPQVAVPNTPDRVVAVAAVAGTRVDHAFVGSCASGTISDLRDAARILRGRVIAPHVRLIVTPGTDLVARQAAAEGLLDIFIAAGAVLTAPGCGPCAGGRIGGLAACEVSINTGTRNDPGRLGPKGSDIFLASPFTVAASAVAGVIADPRDMLR